MAFSAGSDGERDRGMEGDSDDSSSSMPEIMVN